MNTLPEETILDANKVMDVRTVPCSIKHGLIMRTWAEMPVNDHFILVNGHDPMPLYYQLTALFPGCISWEYLERGPEDFRIKITKVKPTTDVKVEGLPQGCSH